MPRIVILMGGCSSERDVSLRSGKAVAEAVRKSGYELVEIDILREELPAGLDAASDVVFPVLHGGFGENGELQALLERASFSYVGCDSASSRLCMDKRRTKDAVGAVGVTLAKDITLQSGHNLPSVDEIISELGSSIVAKPSGEGSSVGVAFIEGRDDLSEWLAKPRRGVWILEQRIVGHELTCGILGGYAMGIVEIAPASGVYDYASKYTLGSTNYLVPAPLPEAQAEKVRLFSQLAFNACGCRDFARADFILPDGGEPVFLEINTLPGMTATSLLPKSASCIGLTFESLVRKMLEPALVRFARK